MLAPHRNLSAFKHLAALALAALLALAPASARAQDVPDDSVGMPEQGWKAWSAAVKLLEQDKNEDALKLLTELADSDVSALRLALMADRTGSLRFEQATASDALGEVGKKLQEKIEAGRKQKMLAEDGWHFAAIGRFNIADANFKALLESDADPVALLELARRNKNRHVILVKLLANTEVGPSARAFLDVLTAGEDMLKRNALEIAANIEKLADSPRVAFNAAAALKVAGEYAVPQLILCLQDPSKSKLHAPVLRLLPQLGRGAMNPLVVALQLKDDVVRQSIAAALGEIGYKQALPYLSRLAEGGDSDASAALRAAAREAMQKISPGLSSQPAALFMDLGEAYHANLDSVSPDPRLVKANVWYCRDGKLVYIAVPTPIFSDVMAMRCCESALELNPQQPQAVALWLASNFRREARLGMNVQSEEPDGLAANDATRPANYPRSIYFARAAGPMHNHLVLGRANKDRDPAEALGAIAALAVTAGPGSLVGPEDYKQALGEALTFPHRLVRIMAALAIGHARPRSQFAKSNLVAPVLSEALTLSGRKAALVVDSDQQVRNKTLAVLRAGGMEAAAGDNLFAAMEAAREQKLGHFDMILLASDIQSPDLQVAVSDLRKDFVTAATPIVVIAKRGDTGGPTQASRLYNGVSIVLSEALEGGTPEQAALAVLERYRRAAATLGIMDLTEELALTLALDAAETIRGMAVAGGGSLEIARTEPALARALAGDTESLRIKAAAALAMIESPTAQQALAEAALADENSATLRLAAFGSLAESGRLHGNKLTDMLLGRVTQLALDGADLVMRTAASQALGALGLPSDKAAEIIKAQSNG